MNETDDEKCSLNKKEQLLIEGYKSLTQYGCQMSQDHISTDRVMIPLSLAPALWVLAPPNGAIDGKAAETLILLGGIVFIVFWMLRNWRSEKRLYGNMGHITLNRDTTWLRGSPNIKSIYGSLAVRP